MVLEELMEALSRRILEPLPGSLAHELLRAVPVGPLRPVFRQHTPPRLGSVLILLYQQDGVIRFPLIKRQEYAGTHSGQVSLPGGKAEANEDPVQTALREAEEEIGVNGRNVRVLGRLTNFFVIPSNFMVTPVIGAIEGLPDFVPDPHEVAKIFHANVADLLREDAVLVKEILVAGQYTMRAPHFDIGGEVVWGATAMILNEFRMVLQDIVKL